MNRLACVYAIGNNATGEAYIGLTGDLSRRWNGHRAALRHRRHDNPPMQAAWERDGEDAFSLLILERLGAEAVQPLDAAYFQREREWQARAAFAGVRLYNQPTAPFGRRQEVLGVTPEGLLAALKEGRDAAHD